MGRAILAIGVLVFLAHFFTALFKRTRVPDVLLLMTLGIVLGPVMHLVRPEDFGKVGQVMSTLALVVILFESGITLDPDVIRGAIRPTLGLTFPTFFITIGISYAVAVYGLGLTPTIGLLTGAILGGVSAAVALPLVKSMGIKEPLQTALVMESALGDVLSIVVLLGLVEGALSGQMAPVKIAGSVLASLAMAGMIGVLGGFGWLLVLNRMRQFPNSAFTTLAFVFIVYGVADELGYSGAIASLAFGATLTNHEHLPWRRLGLFTGRNFGKIEQGDVSFFMEILFLLKTFFFVYLGASIRFSDRWLLLMAVALSAALYLSRLLVVRFLLQREKASWQDLSFASLMVPKGLVSAVLAGIPAERGIMEADVVRNFAYMVVFVSITITASILPLVERRPLSSFYRFLFERKSPKGEVEPAAPPVEKSAAEAGSIEVP